MGAFKKPLLRRRLKKLGGLGGIGGFGGGLLGAANPNEGETSDSAHEQEHELNDAVLGSTFQGEFADTMPQYEYERVMPIHESHDPYANSYAMPYPMEYSRQVFETPAQMPQVMLMHEPMQNSISFSGPMPGYVMPDYVPFYSEFGPTVGAENPFEEV